MPARGARASTLLGLVTAAIGIVVAAGWLAHVPVLTTWHPGGPNQKFLTSVLFVLTGAALTARRRAVVVPLALAVTFAAAAVLIEWSAHTSLSIDHWFVTDHTGGDFPGRPARVSGFMFLFAGTLLLLGDERDRLRRIGRRATMALLLSAALVIVLGYLFNAHEVSSRNGLLPVPTGIAVASLTAGLLAATSYEPPLSWLSDTSFLGTLARRLLPVTLVAPPLIGWLCQQGVGAHLYSSRLALLLFSAATTALLTVATVTVGSAVAQTQRARDLLANELAATFEHLPAAMSLRDTTGTFLQTNQMFERQTRFRPEDVIGKPMSEVFPADLLPWAQAEVDEVLAKASATHSEREADFGNGPRVFDVTRYPVRDGHGTVIGVGTFTLDITDRKRAEEAAASAAARVEAFLEAAPDAIVVVDDHGVIQYANPQLEAMLGYSSAEVVGRSVDILVPDAVRHHHHALREQYAQHPVARPMGGMDLTARHRDGHEVAVEISLGPARTPEGNWTLAAIRDVTTRRAADEIIRVAEARFREELDLAERIQRRLMPTDLPQPPGWDLAVSFTPASHVGGDFYDCWMPDQDLRVVVADVMGKGVSAALVGSGFRVTVNSALSAAEPAEAVRRVAHDMSADLTHTGRFVTCFAARIDTTAGQVNWVDAGHGLAFVLRTEGGHSWLRGTDLPVGVLPDSSWAEHTSALAPGDMLVVVSDGLVDHFQSADALMAKVDGWAGSSARSVLDALVDGLGEPSDDVTAFAIRRELTDATM